MASGLNRVLLMGDLASEPELYVTRGGQVVLQLRLSTTESYLDKDEIKRERASYHQVVVLGPRGDALAKALHRGSRVFIEGSLRTSSVTGRDGKKHFKTEVVASEVLPAGGREGGAWHAPEEPRQAALDLGSPGR